MGKFSWFLPIDTFSLLIHFCTFILNFVGFPPSACKVSQGNQKDTAGSQALNNYYKLSSYNAASSGSLAHKLKLLNQIRNLKMGNLDNDQHMGHHSKMGTGKDDDMSYLSHLIYSRWYWYNWVIDGQSLAPSVSIWHWMTLETTKSQMHSHLNTEALCDQHQAHTSVEGLIYLNYIYFSKTTTTDHQWN